MKKNKNFVALFLLSIYVFMLLVSCRNAGNSETPGLTEDQQLYVVSIKDLVKSVSVSGNLNYSNVEKLSFPSSGKITSLVSDDSNPFNVKSGELIASLDEESIAILEQALIQAEIDLNTANQKLMDFQNIESQKTINEAKLDVTAALKNLQESEKILSELNGDNPPKIQSFKNILSNKQVLVKGKETDIETFKSYVIKMEAALDTAKTTYEGSLLVLDAKNKTLNDANIAYENVLQKWFGASIPNDSKYINMSPENIYQDLGIDLSYLYDRTKRRLQIESFKDLANTSSEGTLNSWIETPYELVALTWLAWHPGLIVGVCEPAQLITIGGFCVSREIEEAWILKQNANGEMNKQLSVVNSTESEITTYQSNLLKAQIDLENSKKALDILMSDEIIAENELSYALVRINDDIEAQGLTVKVNQAKFNSAESDLNFVISKLELDENLIEAKIKKALVSFDQAKENLKNSKIYAPFNGVLTMAVFNEGSSVIAGQIVAQVSSFAEIQFEGNVSESDVLLIKEGMLSEIEVDADRNLTVLGEVSHVSPKSFTSQGLITFPIEIPINMPSDIELKEGMSAVAEVVLYKEQDRILVPLDSVNSVGDINKINVYANETIEERIVELGGNDDFWVAVLSGVEVGEKIVIESALTGTEEFEIDWED